MTSVAKTLRACARMLAAVLVIFACVASEVKASDGYRRAALVIGNADYGGLEALHNTQNDARDMCGALKSIGYTTVCKEDVATRDAFDDVLQNFVAAVTPNTAVVIFYSGHALEMDGQNYLVPTQAGLKSPSDVQSETVSINAVLHRLEIAGNYLSVVILDACRDNPWQGLQRVHPVLAEINDIPRGAVVIYATGANDVALSSAQRNGVLTRSILANIKRRDLTITAMFEEVSHEVEQESANLTGRAQSPALNMRFNGKFCLAGCLRESAVVPGF